MCANNDDACQNCANDDDACQDRADNDDACQDCANNNDELDGTAEAAKQRADLHPFGTNSTSRQ